MTVQLIVGMLLLAPMFLQSPDPNLTPVPKLAQAIQLQVESQIDEEALAEQIAEQIEERIDEDAIEEQVEEHIDRIMGQVNPSDWWLHGVLALLTPFGFFALIALVIWLIYRNSQAKTRARMDFHTQLLGKFTSGSEFAAFLGSKGGQRLLEGLWSQQVNAKERILKAMGAGVVLTVLGLGLLGLSWRTGDFVFLGVLSLALGVGFLISTGISYRLSKKWDLLRDKEPRPEDEPIS